MFCDNNFHKSWVILPIFFKFIITHFLLSSDFVTIDFGEFHRFCLVPVFCDNLPDDRPYDLLRSWREITLLG